MKAIYVAISANLAIASIGFSQTGVPVEMATRLSVSLADRLTINFRPISLMSDSVEASCFPRTVWFVKFLETPEVNELLKLERNQMNTISRIQKEVRVPAELVHAFLVPIPRPGDLQRFAELDSNGVASIFRTLNPDQSSRLREVLNSREMRTMGVVSWLKTRTKLSPDKLDAVRQWMEKQEPLIRDRFKDFRHAAVTDLLRILTDKQRGAAAPFLEAAWISDDPWVFSAQLLALNREEFEDSLESLVEIGAIRFEILADGNTNIVAEPVSQLRRTFMEIVISRAYGGIEPSKEQLDELNSQVFAITASEEDELKVAMEQAQERARKGNPRAVSDLMELFRRIEVSGLNRLHNSLVPVQTSYLREVLLRRAMMSCGPWTVLSALPVAEIRNLEIPDEKIVQNWEETRNAFLNWEADVVQRCWTELAVLCPDAIHEIENASGDLVGLGKPGMLLFFGTR